MESSDKDPETGLLTRAAFLAQVHKARADQTQVRCGCLFILHFPVLQQVHERAGPDAAQRAMRNVLGIVETRLRSRDTMGRLRPHSLGIFLRRCREADAVLIADQYVRLLREVMLDAGDQQLAMDLHYRLVPLDWRGRRQRQGISRSMRSGDEARHVLSMLRSSTPADPSSNSQASSTNASLPVGEAVPDHRGTAAGQTDAGQTGARLIRLAPAVAPASSETSAEGRGVASARLSSAGYRLRPGMVLAHRSLVCCYRVRALNGRVSEAPSPDSALFDAVLDALTIGDGQQRARVDNLIIVPVDAMRLSSESAVWLKGRCRERRVAPSDICLSVQLDSVSRDLRATLPAIRAFNRQGIMMMLEGVDNVVQFSAIRHLAGFEYLLVSSRLLRDSLRQVRMRQELDALLTAAAEQQRQLCADGVDTPALLAHARAMNVEIGFGRECGRSLPLNCP